jgi:hypothetical protein
MEAQRAAVKAFAASRGLSIIGSYDEVETGRRLCKIDQSS